LLKSIKSKVRENILKHELKDIELSGKNIKLIFGGLQPSFIQRYVSFKDRKSGRWIHKKIIKNCALIPISELENTSRDGQYEVSVVAFILKKRISERTRFPKWSHNKNIENENCTMSITQTIKGNILVSTTFSDYKYSITNISHNEKNVFCISGKFSVYSGVNISRCEIVLRRRDTGICSGFKGILKRKDNDLFFDVEIDTMKLQKNLCLNARWDAFIQFRNTQDITVFRALILLKDMYFGSQEDRYLLNLEVSHGNICSLYATENKSSIAFWYIDKKKFEEVYQFAKGKTQYFRKVEVDPLNEKMVVFESFLGKQYTGSPKYIYEEMLRDSRFADFKFIWSICNEKKDEIPGNPITVERGSLEYYKYLAVAKYRVNNVVFPIHHKREGTIYLQTWHGTPLKKLLFDIEFEGPETLGRENFYLESLNWDYLIAQNEFSNETFKRAFRYDREVLVEGYPVNDIFYSFDIKEREEQIKKKLGIPLDKKIILYAPTWRDNEMSGSWSHSFSLKFDIEEFYSQFGDEYVLVLRMHHLISSELNIDKRYKDFILDCSKYSDIQELYIISDILITDYSSVFFDFANSKKPILFFAYDFEVYKNEIRGFYLDMENELPGPIIRTESELYSAIKNIIAISHDYVDKYAEFYERFCSYDDGNSAKRIIDKVF
jgi:CDP-glycerol glycerophosphotransferase